MQWWAERNSQERMIISVGGFLLAIFFLAMVLWFPVKSDVSKLEESIAQKEKDLIRYNDYVAEIKSLEASGAGSRGKFDLFDIIGKTSRRNRIHKELKIDKKSAYKIRIEIEKVKFDSLMKWLDALKDEYGVAITKAAIKKSNKTGYVEVKELMLEAMEE